MMRFVGLAARGGSFAQRCGILTACGVLLAVQTAEAQRPYTPYRPATPTFSPWLNLYQKNTGPLDNYHNYVQPQIQMWETLQQQEQNIQRHGSDIRALGQDVTRFQQPGSVRPTGTGSGFMNYSHYYPSPRTMASGMRHGGNRAVSSKPLSNGSGATMYAGRGF